MVFFGLKREREGGGDGSFKDVVTKEGGTGEGTRLVSGEGDSPELRSFGSVEVLVGEGMVVFTGKGLRERKEVRVAGAVCLCERNYL